jgi:hypothetical protein
MGENDTSNNSSEALWAKKWLQDGLNLTVEYEPPKVEDSPSLRAQAVAKLLPYLEAALRREFNLSLKTPAPPEDQVPPHVIKRVEVFARCLTSLHCLPDWNPRRYGLRSDAPEAEKPKLDESLVQHLCSQAKQAFLRSPCITTFMSPNIFADEDDVRWYAKHMLNPKEKSRSR